jgi:hypothetical protein
MFTQSLKEADISFYADDLNSWRLEPHTEKGLELMVSEGFLPEASRINTPREISGSHAQLIALMAVAMPDFVVFAPSFQVTHGS